jgi:hypothetical protein
MEKLNVVIINCSANVRYPTIDLKNPEINSGSTPTMENIGHAISKCQEENVKLNIYLIDPFFQRIENPLDTDLKILKGEHLKLLQMDDQYVKYFSVNYSKWNNKIRTTPNWEDFNEPVIFVYYDRESPVLWKGKKLSSYQIMDLLDTVRTTNKIYLNFQNNKLCDVSKLINDYFSGKLYKTYNIYSSDPVRNLISKIDLISAKKYLNFGCDLILYYIDAEMHIKKNTPSIPTKKLPNYVYNIYSHYLRGIIGYYGLIPVTEVLRIKNTNETLPIRDIDCDILIRESADYRRLLTTTLCQIISGFSLNNQLISIDEISNLKGYFSVEVYQLIKERLEKWNGQVIQFDEEIFENDENFEELKYKNSPKSSPKNSPKSSPKNSPKSSPKNSPKSSPKNSPKSSPKNSPKSSIPNFPHLRDTFDIAGQFKFLLENDAHFEGPLDGYQIVFTTVPEDRTFEISRAIQEDEILKTKVKLKKEKILVTLNSFYDVWISDPKFRNEILSNNNPGDAMWNLSKTYNYKMANNFIPMYAKMVYKYFNAKIVLDPCAGWGDRMLGAIATEVDQYIGFDPNIDLQQGYIDIMKLGNINQINTTNPLELKFDNGFEIYSEPFEKNASKLKTNYFDLVFTSPPFFDYEIYTPENPTYVNWIEQFYKPLMLHSCRCVKLNGYVAIHIDDTSAGKISDFLVDIVPEITTLKFQFYIGLTGMYSGQTRKIWVFQKFEEFDF